jgi:hypothetical protein
MWTRAASRPCLGGMFFLKKLVSRFLFPVPLCAALLVLGLALRLFTKCKKLGRGLMISDNETPTRNSVRLRKEKGDAMVCVVWQP